MAFRRKSIAALLASLLGALGVHRVYLGQGQWWLPLLVTVATMPWLIGNPDWHRSAAFFILILPMAYGFVEALVLALMPDEKFDARFNARTAQRNDSGWDAVLVAIGTLLIGTIVVLSAVAIFFQTLFER